MNEYLSALEQAAIDSNREVRTMGEAIKLARKMVVHKGDWCIFEDTHFCQEAGWCEGCEIFLRSKGDR